MQVFTLIRSIAVFRKIGILLKRRISPEASTFSGNLGFFHECFRQELRLFSNFGFHFELRFSPRTSAFSKNFGFLRFSSGTSGFGGTSVFSTTTLFQPQGLAVIFSHRQVYVKREGRTLFLLPKVKVEFRHLFLLQKRFSLCSYHNINANIVVFC